MLTVRKHLRTRSDMTTCSDSANRLSSVQVVAHRKSIKRWQVPLISRAPRSAHRTHSKTIIGTSWPVRCGSSFAKCRKELMLAKARTSASLESRRKSKERVSLRSRTLVLRAILLTVRSIQYIPRAVLKTSDTWREVMEAKIELKTKSTHTKIELKIKSIRSHPRLNSDSIKIIQQAGTILRWARTCRIKSS